MKKRIIIAGAIICVLAIGIWGINNTNNSKPVSAEGTIEEITTKEPNEIEETTVVETTTIAESTPEETTTEVETTVEETTIIAEIAVVETSKAIETTKAAAETTKAVETTKAPATTKAAGDDFFSNLPEVSTGGGASSFEIPDGYTAQ